MSKPPKSVLEMKSLLRAIADDRSDLDIRDMDDRLCRRAIDVGLGPALFRVTRQGQRGVWHEVLRAQDLAARVESLARLDALEEILTAVAPELAAEILWLKGVSLSQRIYPQAHLRMMGDLDLLVPSARQADLETVLRELGYAQRSAQKPEFYINHHHSMPFVHARTNIIVEVHTGLFPPASPLARSGLFTPAAMLNRCLPDVFRAIRINRLDNETELAYLAAHWINERRFSGTAIIPMLDLTLWLRHPPAGFDWDRLLAELDGTPAAPFVRVGFGYLHDRIGVQLPATIRQRLAGLRARPRAAVDPCLHAMIDRHALQGAPFGRFWTQHLANVAWESLLAPSPAWVNLISLPWSMLFPSSQPRRYDPRFQLRRWRSSSRRDRPAR